MTNTQLNLKELNPNKLPKVEVEQTEDLIYKDLYQTYGTNNPFVVVYPTKTKEVCYFCDKFHLEGFVYWNTGETGDFGVSLDKDQKFFCSGS